MSPQWKDVETLEFNVKGDGSKAAFYKKKFAPSRADPHRAWRALTNTMRLINFMAIQNG